MPAHKLSLTIRATNGTPWQTDDFGSNQKVDHARKKAIQHFVDDHIMTAGDYALALVHEAVATALIDSSSLEESSVMDGSVLALVVRGPQVDG
jgi:hypothetical protein